MPKLDVYFDYASPFAYFASELLGPIATRHQAELIWKPIDLHKLSNFAAGMPYSPSKRRYVFVDATRTAAFHGIPLQMPQPFPVQSGLALRLALAALESKLFPAFHTAIFRAAWAERRDISTDAVIGESIARAGAEPATWLQRARSAAIEGRLAELTAEAESRGVFGVPSVFLGDELFWGVDSFPALEWRLRQQRGSAVES